MNEKQFETELIQFLSTGVVNKNKNDGRSAEEDLADYVVKTKLWEYKPEIKTTEALWDNFKEILERHNQSTLDRSLSEIEFAQVKQIISGLRTPYEAGQFLYGLNGVSQIEIDLDDGRHVFLTVFDQRQIGAGDTVYQIVNQITRKPIITGKQTRIFDTTLLINGLPIIQIEEKTDTRDINEALNQMHQYVAESQYSDIFSTVQILVAITPNNVKYMANTTADKFNKDFAFNWQRRSDNKPVRKWKEFANSMLSIPMAHQMATNYMILDGTKNKQMIKVMRPYQVYATQSVIDRLKKVDFNGVEKVGYVWHTTGSGKTITSFKTAWLASRLPNVDKVVFVVDRIALTNQTTENYRAYDPDGTSNKGISGGSVDDTSSINDLSAKLRSKDNGIIVTSSQKLAHLVKRKSFRSPEKNIVFVVDEAHRSTGSDNFSEIQKAFKWSAWIGYTGTPRFDETKIGYRTEDIFGDLLHSYTIREAIADRNVLGFKVDFETTIDEIDMKENYLPDFYRTRYPKWSEDKIKQKIANLTQDDMDDAVEPSFYDENPKHVELVVADIFKHWKNRSNNGKYNALFTTHVGGGKASTPMAMMYYREFQRVNKINAKEGKQTLSVAVTFSRNTSNNDIQLTTNKGLFEAVQQYNQEFNKAFGMDDIDGYKEDVISRLNKTASDKQYLDIVIVVDQLLTGFDAPELNTLYVDRTLKGAGLIQAYSRTNRIADMQEKPWGRVVNYRWPAYNEKLMDEALAIYANADSANLSQSKQQEFIEETGVLAKKFDAVFADVKQVVTQLREMTDDFEVLPPSEKKKETMFELLKEYNSGIAKLKQYNASDSETFDGFNYENPKELIEALGMTADEEKMLTTVLTNELKIHIAKENNVSVQQIELKMSHVKDVKIDYDYLTELVEELLNQVYEENMQLASETKGKIEKFALGLDDRGYAQKVVNAANAIFEKMYPPKGEKFEYPARLDDSERVIEDANIITIEQNFLDFRLRWGITEIITSSAMRTWFSVHKYGAKDLDDAGQLRDLIAKARKEYKVWAKDQEIQNLSKIIYGNELRAAIYQLADNLVED